MIFTRNGLLSLASAVFLLTILFVTRCGPPKSPEIQKVSTSNYYAGSETCVGCHEAQFKDWVDSDHDWAMKKPNDSTVLGDFNDAWFKADGAEYFFFKRDGEFWVRTSTAEGVEEEMKIIYTFGVRPLQQYLIAFDKGRLQTLRASWDSEKKRWFHQYAGEEIPHHDWLHWTKGGQRWNTMCAECHSTNVKKNYFTKTDSFHTTYTLINVSCESCHGMAGGHVEWAKKGETGERKYIKYPGRTQTDQIDQCAGCHARRVKLTENFTPGEPFDDFFLVQTISSNLYHPDGQIMDEDYVYGSFLQSQMYHQGVKCTDCHNPHSLQLILDGNQLCMQCHAPEYDTKAHHFHSVDTEASACINCHMTGETYMGNDFRRDHSFRVPRPDQSVVYGTPNACTGCHTDESDQWAAEQVVAWYGEERKDHFSDHLLLAQKEDITEKDLKELKDFVANLRYPSIARATAVEYLPDVWNRESFNWFLKMANDSSVLVRYHALLKFSNLPKQDRIALAGQHLYDRNKAVRIATARMISDVTAQEMPVEHREQYSVAFGEYQRMLQANADFPMGRAQLGDFYLRQGVYYRAIQEYKMALQMDSLVYPVYTNLATAYNLTGDNANAMHTLNLWTKKEPSNARPYYLRGLLYYELQQRTEAMKDLEKAVTLDGSNFSSLYNLALLYYEEKDFQRARVTINQALQVQPGEQRAMELQTLIQRARQ